MPRPSKALTGKPQANDGPSSAGGTLRKQQSPVDPNALTAHEVVGFYSRTAARKASRTDGILLYEVAPDLGPPQAAAYIRTYDGMEAEGIYEWHYQQEGLDPPSKGP